MVFSHVRCVKTRVNLSLVSKLWRDASKPAAAYPRTFNFDAVYSCLRDEYTRLTRILDLLDNDEALSLPYERVVGLLGETAAEHVCTYAAALGSLRLLKWTRENNLAWSANTCANAALNGRLPVIKYLHENGCPWSHSTCYKAEDGKHWDCLQYAVDNECDEWNEYAKKYANHLR